MDTASPAIMMKVECEANQPVKSVHSDTRRDMTVSEIHTGKRGETERWQIRGSYFTWCAWRKGKWTLKVGLLIRNEQKATCSSFQKPVQDLYVSYVLRQWPLLKAAMLSATMRQSNTFFFFLSIFFGAFLPLMYRTVEIDRKQEAERGGMTRRIRPLDSGFEPGL